jgi:putative thioredoxin
MAFDVVDFKAEVVDASHQIPVLVDFWAAWCGPCRILGPILERVAGDAAGRWKLAKVDTEAHPEVARTYGIRGIPDVRLFVDGVPVQGFMGALPEAAVRRWLDEHLPQVADPERARRLEQIEALVAAGSGGEATRSAEALLTSAPDDPGLRYTLARLLLGVDPERVLTLLDRVEPRGVPPEQVEATRTLARILRPSQETSAPLAAALDRVRTRDFEAALEALIGILRAEGAAADPRVRATCVALFQFLGTSDPLVGRYRGDFSRALFV